MCCIGVFRNLFAAAVEHCSVEIAGMEAAPWRFSSFCSIGRAPSPSLTNTSQVTWQCGSSRSGEFIPDEYDAYMALMREEYIVWQFKEWGKWRDMSPELSESIEDFEDGGSFGQVLAIVLVGTTPPARWIYDKIAMTQQRQHMISGRGWVVVASKQIRRIFLTTDWLLRPAEEEEVPEITTGTCVRRRHPDNVLRALCGQPREEEEVRCPSCDRLFRPE